MAELSDKARKAQALALQRLAEEDVANRDRAFDRWEETGGAVGPGPAPGGYGDDPKYTWEDVGETALDVPPVDTWYRPDVEVGPAEVELPPLYLGEGGRRRNRGRPGDR